jgi:hypothetical protein
MSIPDGLNRDHIISAMEQLGPDKGKWPKGRGARHFDVVHPDPTKRWRMPPKLVISEAARIAFGVPLLPQEFGDGYEANGFLRKLGFEIIARPKL